MTSASYRRFAARMSSMAGVRSYVENSCVNAGLAQEDCLKLLLIVEELFTNTVNHGYGGESDSPVWLSLEPCPEGMTLSFEDEAPPHDPFGSYRPMDTTILVKQQPVGGLGLQLIQRLAPDVSYRREHDHNCIKLTYAAPARS